MIIDADRRRFQALRDLRLGFRNWYLWSSLGWHDIRARYRRAVLGPLWLTASLGLMTLAIGVVFGGLFKRDVATYLPYVATGLVIWHLISNSISDAANVFIYNADLARNLNLPLSVHVIRAIWSNLIIFGHNALVVVALAPFTQFGFNANSWLALPGFVLLVLNIVWASFFLAIVSTRFRDIPPLILNLLSLIFLLTPVIWDAQLLPLRLEFVAWNPLFALIDIVRAPLLGQVPQASSWIIAWLGVVLGFPAAIALYMRTHWRIAYWL
jgi:ABC-type polysaccharide/polyol phosphate export permease